MDVMGLIKMEMQFRDLSKEIEREIQDIWQILSVLDSVYEDRLRDSKERAISLALQNSLKSFVDKINEIETFYIKEGIESKMFKCEQMKSNLVDFMVYISQEY